VSNITSNDRLMRLPESNQASPPITRSATVPVGQGIFTKPELAKHLKVSIRTITEMMKRGELAYIKINGRLVRFRLEDVHARLTETCLVCKSLRTATGSTGDVP
jgi:excisionase family DNA binding protein